MWISGSALLENKEQAKSIMIGKIAAPLIHIDRKSTRLNSSHSQISYAVFCLKKKNEHRYDPRFLSFLSPLCVDPSASHKGSPAPLSCRRSQRAVIHIHLYALHLRVLCPARRS